MKRLIPAILLLLVVAGLVIYSRIAIKDVSNSLIGVLNVAIRHNDAGEYELALESVGDFQAILAKNELLLNTFVSRDKIYNVKNASATLTSYANEETKNDFNAEANRTIANLEEVKFPNI